MTNAKTKHSPSLRALLILIKAGIARKKIPRKYLGSKLNNHFFCIGGYYYTVDVVTGFYEETR